MLTIAPCAHEAAAHAVMSWHYSHTLPSGKMFKVGVWEDERFVGAAIISYGQNHNLGSPYGLTGIECVELTRVAMRDHRVPVTQVIAEVLRLLKQSNPGLRLVISFADPAHGHIGKIYQAGNWLYLGRTPSGNWGYVMPDGKRLNKRSYTGHNFGTPRAAVPTRARRIELPAKFRYAYPLDRSMRRRLLPLVQPYPTDADLAAEVSMVTRSASG